MIIHKINQPDIVRAGMDCLISRSIIESHGDRFLCHAEVSSLGLVVLANLFNNVYLV